MATTQITAEPAVPQLVVTSEFAAPRDLLFRAYTDSELLVQWLEPRGLTLSVDYLDPAARLLDQVMLTVARAPSTDRDGNAGELPGSWTLRTAPTGGRRLHLAATGNASRLHRSGFSSDQRRMTCLAR